MDNKYYYFWSTGIFCLVTAIVSINISLSKFTSSLDSYTQAVTDTKATADYWKSHPLPNSQK